MPYLCDTNILLRFTNVDDPEHVLVRDAIHVLIQGGEALFYAQQNRREFWNVCTRPIGRNGLGHTVGEVQQRLAEIDAVFQRLPDHAASGPIWDRLVAQYAVLGVGVHDAQLAATMLAYGVHSILTLNIRDFQRFAAEIVAVHPDQVPPPVGAES